MIGPPGRKTRWWWRVFPGRLPPLEAAEPLWQIVVSTLLKAGTNGAERHGGLSQTPRRRSAGKIAKFVSYPTDRLRRLRGRAAWQEEMAMAVDFLQKTAGTAVRGQPFRKGQSGNPAGRPRGARNRATQNAELLLEGEAEALTRKAVELALGGDPAALRLPNRLTVPPRERSIQLTLPPIASVADIACAMPVRGAPLESVGSRRAAQS